MQGARWLLGGLITLGCDLTRFEARHCPEVGEEETQHSACVDGSIVATDPAGTADEAAGQDASTPATDPSGSDAASDDPVQDDGAADDPSADDSASDDPGADDPSEPPADDSAGDSGAPAIECDTASSDHVRAYFEVPGAKGGAQGDYFRLPFPNDFYRNGQRVSLGNFPAVTPGSQRVVEAVNQTADGFSAAPTLLFRFSGKVNFKDSVISRFHLLDITDPNATSSPPLKLLYSPAGGKYICHDWLAVRAAPSHPLTPGHTYAAWLDQGVLASNGLQVEGADHFKAMLADSTPSDPVLATLHAKYEPLRVYLATTNTAPSSLLNGTVFTVGEVRTPMQALAAQVAALPSPQITQWVKCQQGAVSPCPDSSGARACGPSDAAYEEYHALIALPIFQRGQAPYLDEGGTVDTNSVVRTEDVCLSLTVPTAPPPPTGFAVAVVAHAAGGSFRSHVRPEVAGMLSEAETPAGEARPLAVLGYDLVQHGPRRGAPSELDAESLLISVDNPQANAGIALQGAVDVLSMTRAATELVLPGEISARPEIVFDPLHVVFWGQAEGAMHAAVALSYTDDVQAAVFSSLSAGFVATQLRRREPASIQQAIAAALDDPSGEGEPIFGGEYHPALGLWQQLVDPGDPINYAERLTSADASAPLHVFQVYGTGDSFAAGVVQHSFARAADLAVVQADPSAAPADDLGTEDGTFPLSGNLTRGDVGITAGIRQYGPAGDSDGHFVAYEVPSAALDIAAFLAMAVSDETPQIGR